MPKEKEIREEVAQAQEEQTSKKFDLFTPMINFWEEDIELNKDYTEKGEGVSKERFIQVTVSGLKEDRDGERISQEAIDDMIMQYKSGTIPLFPNHGRDATTGERVYNWQDIMGVWVDAEQKEDKILATARLNKGHPDSEKFWNYVKSGMPLGFSIGGKPTKEQFEEITDE